MKGAWDYGKCPKNSQASGMPQSFDKNNAETNTQYVLWPRKKDYNIIS